MTSERKYVVLAHGLDTTVAGRIRAADHGRHAQGRGPRARARPRLPPGRRRPEHDPRGEAPRASSTATASASTASSSTTRNSSPASHASSRPRRDIASRQIPESAVVTDPGAARRGPPPHDRCRPAALRRAGDPRRVGRGPGEVGLGGRDEPVHRRDPRRGLLPVVRRQRLRRDRGQQPHPLHRPDRQLRLRAGLGVQDADLRRGPRARRGHDEHPDQGHRAS